MQHKNAQKNVFIILKRWPILPSNVLVLASMSFTSQNSLNRGSADGTAIGHVCQSFRTVWAEARMSTGDKSNSWAW